MAGGIFVSNALTEGGLAKLLQCRGTRGGRGVGRERRLLRRRNLLHQLRWKWAPNRDLIHCQIKRNLERKQKCLPFGFAVSEELSGSCSPDCGCAGCKVEITGARSYIDFERSWGKLEGRMDHHCESDRRLEIYVLISYQFLSLIDCALRYNCLDWDDIVYTCA